MNELEHKHIIWGRLFVSFFILYPYIFLMNMVFPFKFVGFNVFFVFTTLVFFLFFLFSIFEYKKSSVQPIVLFSGLMFFIFLSLHFFNEDVYSIKMLMSNRIGFTLVFYLLISFVASNIVGDNKISKIIVINAFIQAVIGIVHYHFFSNIVTGNPLVPPGKLYVILEEYYFFREPGILVSASLYANMVLLGVFLVGYKIIDSSSYVKRVLYILLLLVMLYGMTLSHSRYPSIIGFLFVIYVLFIYLKKYYKFDVKGISFISVCVVVGFIPLADYILPELYSMFLRFSYEGMGVRTVKNELAFNVIVQNLKNLLVGADVQTIGSAVSIDGIGISDNSFLALGMNYGLLYLFFVLSVVGLLLINTVKLTGRIVFLIVYFIGNLFLTNAIYWDIYLLYFYSVIFVVGNKYLFMGKQEIKYIDV